MAAPKVSVYVKPSWLAMLKKINRSRGVETSAVGRVPAGENERGVDEGALPSAAAAAPQKVNRSPMRSNVNTFSSLFSYCCCHDENERWTTRGAAACGSGRVARAAAGFTVIDLVAKKRVFFVSMMLVMPHFVIPWSYCRLREIHAANSPVNEDGKKRLEEKNGHF